MSETMTYLGLSTVSHVENMRLGYSLAALVLGRWCLACLPCDLIPKHLQHLKT